MPPKDVPNPVSQKIKDRVAGATHYEVLAEDTQHSLPVVAPTLPGAVKQLIEELLGPGYAEVMSDDVKHRLLSSNNITVSLALSNIIGQNLEVEQTLLLACAANIAEHNRPKTVHEILDTIVLSSTGDTMDLKKFCAEAVHVTTTKAVEFARQGTPENSRVLCVSAVMGPAGVGKTAYCTQAASKNLRATVPTKRAFTYYTKWPGGDGPCAEDVYAAAREYCKPKGAILPEDTTYLKDVYLHVIVDECENFPVMTDKDFEKWRDHRIKHFLAAFAGVHITLAGTMLDVNMVAVGSESDGFWKIRLRPWRMDNFKAFLVFTIQGLGSNLDVMTRFVESSPLLMSLTTNARAAVFMVQIMRKLLDQGSVRGSPSSILDQVVFEYLKYNGLSAHTAEERASVGLAALQCALGVHINAEEPNRPSVVEAYCLRVGLVGWNLELVKAPDGMQYKCVGGNRRIDMQPALVLVCLVMCGLLPSSRQIEGWCGVELITALWAACSIPYPVEVTMRLVTGTDKLETRLASPTGHRMPYYHVSAHAFGSQQKVAGGKMLFANIPLGDVPIVAVINADKGAGMDVVAPWLLVQAKYNASTNSPHAVNVMDELKKAGLFLGSLLLPLTHALTKSWGASTPGAPPAVLAPLSQLLEHIPTSHWGSTLTVGDDGLTDLKTTQLDSGASPTLKTVAKTRVGSYRVNTEVTIDPVPANCVRVVLMLVGHAFTLKTSGIKRLKTSGIKRLKTSGIKRLKTSGCKGKEGNSPQLQVTGDTGGSARLLTVTKKHGVWMVAANPKAVPEEAMPALQRLAEAVMNARPEVAFVLDVVYQPLTEASFVVTPPCAGK
jgi:hypothetical protein